MSEHAGLSSAVLLPQGGIVLLRSQKGTGLIEILIVMGMTAIMSVVIATLMKDSAITVSKVKASQDTLSLQALLREHLKYTELCTAAIGKTTVDLASPRNSIELQIGSTLLKDAQNVPEYGIRVLDLRLRDSRVLTASYLGQTVMVGEVKMVYESIVGEHAFRSISAGGISLVVDSASKIVRCFSHDSPEHACLAMGGTFNPSTAPNCRLCAAGEVASYSTSGELKCLALSSCPRDSVLSPGADGALTCRSVASILPPSGGSSSGGSSSGGSGSSWSGGSSSSSTQYSSSSGGGGCSASAFLCSAYQSSTGRVPDQAGANYWENQLATLTSQYGRAEAERIVANSIATSSEAQGRGASASEVSLYNSYAAATSTSSASCSGISCGAGSGGSSGATTTSQIEALYATNLGRTSDAAGMAYWQQQISSGAATMADVEWAIRNSAEAQGR